MKERIFIICFTVLYFHTRLSLASSAKVLAEAGKRVTLRCDTETKGAIEWRMDKEFLIKYIRSQKYSGTKAKDKSRYSVPSHMTNNLIVMNLRIADSGTYTCQNGNSIFRTVELFVFQVSIHPSANILSSEDLVLKLTSLSSQIPGLQVSWEKDGTVKSGGPILEENNMRLNSGGTYVCRIKMDGGNSLDITSNIKVLGFYDNPPIVYTSGKNPVTIPWTFNFPIRKKITYSDIHVEDGSISYSSQIIGKLSVAEGSVSWPATSDSKDASETSSDHLSIQLLNPKSGKYQMHIGLKIGDRRKNLTREVCVASLTVPDSKNDFSPDTIVPLQCRVTCMDSYRKLCWHQLKTGREMCGQEGELSFTTEVTTGNETAATWNCSVTDGKERLVSAMVTLEVKSFLDLSSTMFWVLLGVGIFIFLVIVVIITIVIARNRRLRRERYRAWLLENIHQKRRCECTGFAPKRLKSDYV
ncbi:T-cell surface glycoprotein CD4 [Hyla sarda]|uniref:T-cell surface glycoprotein CD4 n=1 Tax=Hyla sarda TaxID=327740 RepID=UPI0024C37923|nr:T-cell surface glycoprotein CD4 [Hyla sarda]XP_056385867.1 T-cell surface glycoprotein CD4 [Hyla sarda]XP_056385868.1 T-cell surface glycoprotein CD4 [Hyla sarda]XP_056385869.1 T-cell surface glycoprotein CD4 [Hyla sarda]XP_056385870.1 T-cell surface glycoprotein CD4 [Hyla sarda]XP_056385872.1 T-cell surface glycoprotein CD4 [Hyla sarda]